MVRRLFGLAVGALLGMAPTVTWASASYPPFIKQQLGAACEPQCTVCHNSLNGGAMTVTTKFGRNMMSLFGLIGASQATLQRALDQAKAQGLDSDGDGDTDIDALIACRDPNVPYVADGGIAPPPANAFTDPTPEYGCAIGRPVRGGEGVRAAMPVGVAILLRRRRRRLGGHVHRCRQGRAAVAPDDGMRDAGDDSLTALAG